MESGCGPRKTLINWLRELARHPELTRGDSHRQTSAQHSTSATSASAEEQRGDRDRAR
jgi:hypothetical protein